MNQWDKWHEFRQEQVCIMIKPMTPEEFAEHIFVKDSTAFNKVVADFRILMKFTLENLIKVLGILEKGLPEESDKDRMHIYKKFIIQTKWIILWYWDNVVAKEVLKKHNLKFSSILYSYDFGNLNWVDWNWEKRVIEFQDIKLSEIEEIYKEIEHCDSATWWVSKNVDWINERLKAIAFHVKWLDKNLSGIDEELKLKPEVQAYLVSLLWKLSSIVAENWRKINFSPINDNMR